MADQVEAIRSVLPTIKKELKTCICVKAELQCEKELAQNVQLIFEQNQCPRGFQIQTILIDSPSDEDEKKYLGFVGDEISVRVDQQGYTYLDLNPVTLPNPRPAKPKKKSLLHPAHFRMITQPICNSANERYKACTEEAYKTSSVDGACSETAKKCQSNTDWLN